MEGGIGYGAIYVMNSTVILINAGAITSAGGHMTCFHSSHLTHRWQKQLEKMVVGGGGGGFMMLAYVCNVTIAPGKTLMHMIIKNAYLYISYIYKRSCLFVCLSVCLYHHSGHTCGWISLKLSMMIGFNPT